MALPDVRRTKAAVPEDIPNPNALLISADAALRATVTSALSATDWRCEDVTSFAEALRYLRGAPRQAIFIDQGVPGGPIEDLVAYARRQHGPDAVVVTFLQTADRPLAIRLVRAGATFFAAKPADPVFLTRRLSELLFRVRPLEPFPMADDPLARPLVVVGTRSLELSRQVAAALEDECTVAHYEGSRFPAGADTQAAILLVDEGLPNGLETLTLLRAVFGGCPALALVARGGLVPDAFAGTIVKPAREAALRRQLRQLLGRLHLGVAPTPSGVVLRLREAWAAPAESENLRLELAEIARNARASNRRWICFDVGPLQTPEQRAALLALMTAVDGVGLHAGVATVTADTTRTAFELGLHRDLVHGTPSSFIRWAQDLA